MIKNSNPYQISSYQGDSEYSINAKGDAVVGDKVRFEKAVFSGSFRSAKFERFELITGEIIKDSYGDAKQQHTFTLLLSNGEKMIIKGRNLYRNGLWRKPWLNENQREQALIEKHRRGRQARSDRRERLERNNPDAFFENELKEKIRKDYSDDLKWIKNYNSVLARASSRAKAAEVLPFYDNHLRALAFKLLRSRTVTKIIKGEEHFLLFKGLHERDLSLLRDKMFNDPFPSVWTYSPETAMNYSSIEDVDTKDSVAIASFIPASKIRNALPIYDFDKLHGEIISDAVNIPFEFIKSKTNRSFMPVFGQEIGYNYGSPDKDLAKRPSMVFEETKQKSNGIKANPLISKDQKKVYANGIPLKSLEGDILTKNAIFKKLPSDPNSFINFPENSYYIFVFDTEESAQMADQNKLVVTLFPMGGAGRLDPFKNYWKHEKTGHLISAIWFRIAPEEKKVYIEMMSVRPGYRRNSLNNKMIYLIKKEFDCDKVDFGELTTMGAKFAKEYEKKGNIVTKGNPMKRHKRNPIFGDSVSGSQSYDKKVVSDLSMLALAAKEAKEKGKQAPEYDLCEISVPGTNLFCQVHKGIPRAQMPQLKGHPVEGTVAAKLPKDKDGEVNSEDLYKKALKINGIKTTPKSVPAASLKATQSQLVGAKVAGMLETLKKEPDHPKITAPIYVSRDGYILDGHHRWAAVVGLDMARRSPTQKKPVMMNVVEVDMDIKDLVEFTNDFTNDVGIAQKKASVKQNPRFVRIKQNPQNLINVDQVEKFINDGIKDKKIQNQDVINWLNNTFRKHLINSIPSEEVLNIPSNAPDWAKEAFKRKELRRALIIPTLKNEYYHVLDFILSDKPKLGSAMELLAKVKEKDEQRRRRMLEFEERTRMSKKSVNVKYDEMGKMKTLYTFKDGYSMVSLLDDKAKDWEGVVMGHCVGDSNYDQDTIYSLRDEKMMPHATMQLDGNKIVQIQGKENKPVIEKYHEYIYEFLEQFPKLKVDDSELPSIGLMRIVGEIDVMPED